MRGWIAAQLRLLAPPTRRAVVLDPECAAREEDVRQQTTPGAEVVLVDDWWALRCAFEAHWRRRLASATASVLILQGPVAGEPLPWDIERDCERMVSLRLPGPPQVRQVLAELVGPLADEAVAAVVGSSDPVGALLRATTAQALDGGATLGTQLAAVARLAVHPEWPSTLRQLAVSRISHPTLAGLLADPPATGELQAAWRSVVAGESGPWNDAFAQAGPELSSLFARGVLQPEIRGARQLPGWAAPGLREPTREEQLVELLDNPPHPWLPSAAEDWVSLAAWWGRIRAIAASSGPPIGRDLQAAIESTWQAIDQAFLPWLRDNYGALLSSAATWPPALHRIGPFLARRLRARAAERILLIVLDGMAFAQWERIRERAALVAVEAGGTFAMLPTYTTVCRQTIFAGRLPLMFGDTLWETSAEARRWSAFWSEEGVTEGVAFHRVDGRLPTDTIPLDRRRVVGVVVNAVDEIMHGSDLLGDAQVMAAVEAWADTGFLAGLVGRAWVLGYEVWLTADHGNIECRPAGKVAEGVAIVGAGKRLRRYPNRVLRDASRAEGLVWDAIPGLPSDADPLLFAPGRLAFMQQAVAVSHGGLSLDEVVVPLVRVEPRVSR